MKWTQATEYPTGALKTATELEDIFRGYCERKEDMKIYLVRLGYSPNQDRCIAFVQSQLIPHTSYFSDRNIYYTQTTASRKVFNFWAYNLLGRGQPTPDFAFMNYFHAYAHALRVNNGPSEAEKLQNTP